MSPKNIQNLLKYRVGHVSPEPKNIQWLPSAKRPNLLTKVSGKLHQIDVSGLSPLSRSDPHPCHMSSSDTEGATWQPHGFSSVVRPLRAGLREPSRVCEWVPMVHQTLRQSAVSLPQLSHGTFSAHRMVPGPHCLWGSSHFLTMVPQGCASLSPSRRV